MNSNASITKEKISLSSLFDKKLYTFGNVPKSIEQCIVDKVFISANKNECLVKIPSIADYYINQNGITVDAKTDDENRFDQIKVFADIYAMPAYTYLSKKKDLFLNASAVRKKDGKAVLFCGVSSSGKSTLAFELCNHGADFIADEYVKVFSRDGKVYAKSYQSYSIISKKDMELYDKSICKPIYPNSHRHIVYQDNCCTDACEIDTIIILKSFHVDSIKAEVVSGEDKLKVFPSLIHMAELASTYIPVPTLFTEIISMVDNLDMVKVDYNKDLYTLENTVNKILSAVEKEKNE